MLYSTCRLSGFGAVGIDKERLDNLVQELERIDESTWKIWVLTEIVSDGDNYKVYRLEQEWQPTTAIGKASAGYIRIHKERGQTVVTVLAANTDVIEDISSILRTLHIFLKPVTLDNFLNNNQDLSVQSAEIFEETTGSRFYHNFLEPVRYEDLVRYPRCLDKHMHCSILSVTASPRKYQDRFLDWQSQQRTVECLFM